MPSNKSSMSKEEDGESLLSGCEHPLSRWSSNGRQLWPWSSRSVQFSSVGHNEEQATIAPRRRRLHITTLLLAIIITLAYVSVTFPMLVKAGLARRTFSCGTTLEEAKARGCTFDPMTVQWLPKQCSRRGLDEFLVAHGTHTWTKRSEIGNLYPDQTANESTWRYFTDETQSTEYLNGLIDAPIGHYKYVTTRGEHLAHCAFILIRGAEARAHGERVDLLSSDLEHTRHCALFLFEYARNTEHFDTINTPGDVMLGAC
ncbi:hypothetical protein VTL71DRAFT_6837 [Oculimacula yallundae]|uniref:Uncharacterized protein n=1 Tax=Oculimacula yallundae TaxID=86028 RepID=A0ABR4BUY1_9HELO